MGKTVKPKKTNSLPKRRNMVTREKGGGFWRKLGRKGDEAK